jgi:D-alanyl-D-alanine carboxypeptidase (penicillin-binding protein 5/6)
MTYIVSVENIEDVENTRVEIKQDVIDLLSGTGSSMSGLDYKIGEKVKVIDLLYCLMVSSGNDAALVLADYIGGGDISLFVNAMNEKAKELKLENTHFMNPHGLHDDNHYTTPRDMYTLTKHALKNETFKEITSTPRYIVSATNMSGERRLTTTNYLQNTTTNYYYQYAKGVKTGFTDEAGRCLVSTASYNGYNYMCIVMGCPGKSNRHFADSKALYRWAFNNFSFKEIAKSTERSRSVLLLLSLERLRRFLTPHS